MHPSPYQLLLLVPFLLLFPQQTAGTTTITITAAPSIPSKEPSFSKRYLFTAAVLSTSNRYRKQHNASSLAWNATLASFAGTYLAGAQRDDCRFAHSGGPYGENIALGYGNASAAVEAWGDERRVYDFGKGEFGEDTGHFTQLVWKDTRAVGCERVLCGPRGWFVACEYWPRGNVQGEYKEEVQREVSGGNRLLLGCRWMVVVVVLVLVLMGIW